MKNILKFMCFFMIFTLCSMGVYAADSEKTREEAAQRAAFCRQQMDIRESVLKRHYSDNRVSLMSNYQIPSVLKKLSEKVTIYNSDEIYEEIYFAQTTDSYWFDAVLYSVKDKIFIEDSYVSVNGMYDDYDRCEGVYIDYVDAWDLDAGEYYIYIIDDMDNYYEPVTFIVNPFEMYDTTFSTDSEYNYIYLNMEKTDVHYNGRILETLTFEGFDDNKNRAFLLENMPVSYASVHDIEVYAKFPSYLNGKYNLSITLNFTDGTKENIGHSTIYVGDYIIVDRMYSLNNQFTPETKNIPVLVELSKPLESGDRIKLVMEGIDSGKIIAEETEYKLSAPEYSNNLILLFDAKLSSPVYEEIIFYVECEGEGETYCDNNGYIEFSYSAFYEVKKIGENKYSMKTEGIEPGVYEVKLDDEYAGPSGVMEVDENGNGFIETKGDYIEHRMIYLSGEENSYRVRTSYVEEIKNKEKQLSIHNVRPSYIMNNSTSLTNMYATLEAERSYSADEIEVKLYDYYGKEVASATDIKVTNSYFEYDEIHKVKNSIKFSFNNLPGSFSTNYVLSLVIIADGKCAETEIYVADSDTFGCSTNIYCVNSGYKFGGIISEDEYYYDEICLDTALEKAVFAIDWTNRPLEYAELYKYNLSTREFELYSRKSASQLTAEKSVYGNGYGYNIEFPVSHEGIYRMMTEEDESELVYVTLKNFVYNDYEFLNVTEDYNYLYMESAGLVPGAETFGAYYINSYGQKISIPVTYEYDENYVDFVFNFSNIRNFGYMCVYITCNGADAGSVMAYEMRDESFNVEIYGDIKEIKTYLGIYGNGLDNITNPVLNICTEENYQGTKILSSPFLTKSLNLTPGYTEIYEDELNLKPGLYYVYLSSDNRIISAVSLLMIMDKTSESDNMPVKILRAEFEYDSGNIKLLNTGSENYDNAVIFIVKYDDNGEIMSVNMENVQLKAGCMLRMYPDIILDAAEYKLFIIGNKSSLKPLARLY